MTRKKYLGALSGSLAAAELPRRRKHGRQTASRSVQLRDKGGRHDGRHGRHSESPRRGGQDRRRRWYFPPPATSSRAVLRSRPGQAGRHSQRCDGTGSADRHGDPHHGRPGQEVFRRSRDGQRHMVRGLMIFYPEQVATDLHPYPWTFHLQGVDNTVENVTIVNTYNGIRVGPEINGRHRLRSVVGCALRRGVLVDTRTRSAASKMCTGTAISGRAGVSTATALPSTSTCRRFGGFHVWAYGLGICHQHVRLSRENGLPLYQDRRRRMQRPVLGDRGGCGAALRFGGGDPAHGTAHHQRRVRMHSRRAHSGGGRAYLRWLGTAGQLCVLGSVAPMRGDARQRLSLAFGLLHRDLRPD